MNIRVVICEESQSHGLAIFVSHNLIKIRTRETDRIIGFFSIKGISE